MLLVVSLREEWDERRPSGPNPCAYDKKTQPPHNLRRPARRLLKRSVLHSELDHTASRTTPRKDASTSFKPLFAPAFPVSFEKRS